MTISHALCEHLLVANGLSILVEELDITRGYHLL